MRGPINPKKFKSPAKPSASSKKKKKANTIQEDWIWGHAYKYKLTFCDAPGVPYYLIVGEIERTPCYALLPDLSGLH
jgi:hypothetical protein